MTNQISNYCSKFGYCKWHTIRHPFFNEGLNPSDHTSKRLFWNACLLLTAKHLSLSLTRTHERPHAHTSAGLSISNRHSIGGVITGRWADPCRQSPLRCWQIEACGQHCGVSTACRRGGWRRPQRLQVTPGRCVTMQYNVNLPPSAATKSNAPRCSSISNLHGRGADKS